LKSRKVIQDIILGKDKRILLISGPCSVHNYEETLEWAKSLSVLMKVKQNKFFHVMRVCFDKPRTRKDWEGYMTDPYLNDTCDMAHGSMMVRRLMLEILELGVPIACEMLWIDNYNLVSDMVSYAWIGARTMNSPNTRRDACSITAPVGVKNSNSKDTFDDAINALDVVTKPGFMACAGDDGYRSRIPTKGNKLAHIILRGGSSGPNYSRDHVAKACEELRVAGFINRVLIDCSHGNVNGEYLKQLDIFQDIVCRIEKGEKGIIGMMMEVYLDGDKQSIKLGRPDSPQQVKPRLSVTDKCLSFEDFCRVFKENI
jgi:3-deoxy-7-phosphoheptulonate synthase